MTVPIQQQQQQEQQQHHVPTTIQNSYGEFQQIAGYTVTQTLGSGSFANVFKGVKQPQQQINNNAVNTDHNNTHDATEAQDQAQPDIVAIKAINRNSDKITKKVLQNLELEISILQTYRHANIVCLNTVHKTDQHIFLFLEYCAGGDLQRLIRTRKSGRVTERLARRLMRDLTAGLLFLAKQQLIHRDIKPQNLLLTGPLPLDELYDLADNPKMEEERLKVDFPSHLFHLKIADFGFARHLQKTSLADTLCGSPLYMAPEILQHKSYDNKADLWSAGTVLFEMIAGRPPFHGENHIDLLRNIQQKAVRLPPDLTVSKECVKLLRILLNRNPIMRASFNDFVEASNAFVALGCNGVDISASMETEAMENGGEGGGATTMDINLSCHNLGPISEEETNQTSTMIGTSTRTVDSMDSEMKMVPQQLSQLPMTTQNVVVRNTQNMQTTDIRRHFIPLEPSPPGPKPIRTSDDLFPPPFLLGMGNHDHRQMQQYATSNMVLQRTNGKSESSQNSDDSEFVMVEKGSASTSPSTSAARIEESRAYTRSPIGMWKQSSQRRSSSPSSRSFNSNIDGGNGNSAPPSPVSPTRSNSCRYFSGKSILSSRNLIPPAIPFLSKGMLSTSPGTGGALVGMMGNATAKDNAIIADRGDMSSSLVMPQHGVFNYELFARMLAAAEDVGRRAIHVAHVGDTRAYLAMKFIMANESVSSFYGSSVTPMEGVVEECDAEGIGVFDETNSTSSVIHSKRGRAVSTDQSVHNNDDDEDDQDDEMPFAMPSTDDDNNSITTPKGFAIKRQQQQHPPTLISSGNPSKKLTKTSNLTIKIHFREALSCYIKSLTMLKGSVNASQRIIAELNSLGGASSSNEIESINQFKKRCEASNDWLVGQFKGVLERADAGKSEISKLSSTNLSSEDEQQQQTENNSASIINVEELIYNHSLACGKDGAVKQLLGQHESSRASYRSAGLLIETLLMEPRLVEEDKKALESYVQGFAERINELDYIMLNQNKQSSMVASSASSRRGSSIIPLVGGGGFVQSTR